MTLLKRMAISLAVLCIAAGSVAVAEDSDFDVGTGLRIHHYTDPVPETVPGGVVLDTEGIKQLIDTTDVVLIDVLSISGIRYDELDGSWSGYEPRFNIPGSLWLPNVGYGRPSPDMLRYFLNAVAKATDGQLDHPVLIYCISDCWMGWNAVQHLARAGYSKVYWGPLGTDGWAEAGYELELTEPTPVDVDSL
jgi:PQQ-dependent catabolism-associated CXXCW motif protein